MPIQLRRGPKGEPITNVPHRVTRRTEDSANKPPYEWGFHGTGPNELAMNVLYDAGLSEAEAYRLSSFFAQEIIAGIPLEGATIPDQVIQDWIALKR